ncbi:MAG: hypothetical protein ACOC9W_00255 [Persicimonas sp.]
MGATELTISLRGADADLEPARLARLQREVWDSLLDFFSRYVGEYRDVWAYLHDMTRRGSAEGWFRADQSVLRFEFPDHQGQRLRSAAAAKHWSRLGVAARQKTLASLAEHADVGLEADSPNLETLVFEPDALFVPIKDTLWKVDSTQDGSFELVGDAETRPSTALSEEARRQVEQVVDSGLCACGMCARLRPDEEFEARWRLRLSDAPEVRARQALQYLLQSVSPSREAIVDLAGFAPRANIYRHTRQLFEFGKRLDADRLGFVRESIEEADDPRIEAALVALMAGLPLDAETRTDVLIEAFDAESPVAETAVEFLGYGPVAPDRLDDLVEQLEQRAGDSQDLDHAIALTLYNLFRSVDYPPRSVKETLERVAGRAGEAADVATRALSWFERR